MPFHKGHLATNAESLMRSRYSAYAMGNLEYILLTTHPKHPDQTLPQKMRKDQILSFMNATSFNGLEIIEHTEQLPYAFVTFFAQLKQGDLDISFKEKSRFEKLEGKWYYLNGEIFN